MTRSLATLVTVLNKLDVSYNPQIKDIDTDYLFHNLKVNLNELNIEGNNVGDQLIIKLCEWNHRIKSLNFSRNLLTNKSGVAIANNLIQDKHIIAINLSWNNIQSRGAAAIWDAIAENDTLNILDLSFNPIGIGKHKASLLIKHSDAADKISKPNNTEPSKLKKKEIEPNSPLSMSNMFRLNKSLVHWDFSNWGFSKSECKIMSKGLNENHTILGLHMIGNQMNTSPLGFLKEDDGNPGASHILAHVANKDLKVDKSKLKFQYNITSNCWIWERWVEIKVIFDPAKWHHPLENQLSERDRMLIHFSFENFEPDVLFKDEETGLYYSERMVIYFNFSI